MSHEIADNLMYNRRGLLSPEQLKWARDKLGGGPLVAATTQGDVVDDLAEGRVVALQGEVVWGKTTVHVRVGSREHSQPFEGLFVRASDGRDHLPWTETAIPPGPYQCYVLPRSRFVIACEPHGTADEHLEKFRAMLCERQRLPPLTLAENRAGRPTSAQLEKLRADARRDRLIALGLVLAPLVLCAILVASIPSLRTNALAPLLFVAGVETLFAIPALVFLLRARRFTGDANEARIVTFEGRVEMICQDHADANDTIRSQTYQAVAGGKKLTVDTRVGVVMSRFDRHSYRISYAPRSHSVLSVDVA